MKFTSNDILLKLKKVYLFNAMLFESSLKKHGYYLYKRKKKISSWGEG